MSRTRSCLLALALATLCCEARTRVGYVISNDGYGGARPLPEVPPDPAFSFPDGVAGIWTGYLEGYSLQSGSDAITLTLNQSAGGDDQIHVVFGTNPPPPPLSPATDPGEEWPPADYGQSNPRRDLGGLFDTFSYAGHLVEWQDRRLKFSVAPREPWDSWCALQTGYAGWGGGGGYSAILCIPPIDCDVCYAVDPPLPRSTICPGSANFGVVVTCAQYDLCASYLSPYCVCDADRCDAAHDRYYSFDITFDSNSLLATGVAQFDSLVTLRLMR